MIIFLVFIAFISSVIPFNCYSMKQQLMLNCTNATDSIDQKKEEFIALKFLLSKKGENPDSQPVPMHQTLGGLQLELDNDSKTIALTHRWGTHLLKHEKVKTKKSENLTLWDLGSDIPIVIEIINKNLIYILSIGKFKVQTPAKAMRENLEKKGYKIIADYEKLAEEYEKMEGKNNNELFKKSKL